MKKLIRLFIFLLYTAGVFALGAYIGKRPGIVSQGVSVVMPKRELRDAVIADMMNEFRKNRGVPELKNHNGLNKMALAILKTFEDNGVVDSGAFLAMTRSDDNSDDFCRECYKFAQNAAMDFVRADDVIHRWTTTDRESLRNLRDTEFNLYGIAVTNQFVVVIFGAVPPNQL